MNFEIRWYFISITIYHGNVRNKPTPCHILEYNENCYYVKPSIIFGQNWNTFWCCSCYIMNNVSPGHLFVNKYMYFRCIGCGLRYGCFTNNFCTQFKFDGKFCSNSFSDHQIGTNFCTCHDSTAVVPSAKTCCDHCIRIEVRVKRNFHRIWIGMVNPLVKRGPGFESLCIYFNATCLPKSPCLEVPSQLLCLYHTCISVLVSPLRKKQLIG